MAPDGHHRTSSAPSPRARAWHEDALCSNVEPGAHLVTQQAGHVLVTVLGSCVAACLRDPVAGVGGMNHFMLPSSVTGEWGGISASLRYGNFAMEQLINDILRRGGSRGRLQAKLFGGAAMVANNRIGDSNASFVEAYLKEEGISVVGGDLRGSYARCVKYQAVTGKALMRRLRLDAAEIVSDEKTYAGALAGRKVEGTVELFTQDQDIELFTGDA
jgi:chemotaxis protein CheD